MRKSRFSEEKMVSILRETDRDPVPTVAKRHGISEQTIYTWRKRFGAMQSDSAGRLKQAYTQHSCHQPPLRLILLIRCGYSDLSTRPLSRRPKLVRRFRLKRDH